MTDDADDPQERYDPNRTDDHETDATMTDSNRQRDTTRGSDAGPTESTAPPVQGTHGPRDAGASGAGGGALPRRSSQSSLPDDPRTLVYWAGLVVCGVLAVVALVSFYTSMLDVIRTWVDPEYRSLFRSAFSLVVLVGAVLGVSLTVRELGE